MSFINIVLVSFTLISTCLSKPIQNGDNNIRGPEQVHIAYGDHDDEMTVVWSTANISSNWTSYVRYGLRSDMLDKTVDVEDALLTEGNPEGLKQVHRAILKVY